MLNENDDEQTLGASDVDFSDLRNKLTYVAERGDENEKQLAANGLSHLDGDMSGYSIHDLNEIWGNVNAMYDSVKTRNDDFTPEERKTRMDTRYKQAQEIGEKLQFVVDQNGDDESLAEETEKAKNGLSNLAGNASAFDRMSDSDVAEVMATADELYNAAEKRRGHWQVFTDALKRGWQSAGRMAIEGGLMLKPGELTDEDRATIRALKTAGEQYDIAHPKRTGDIREIGSAGDVIDYVAELAGENAVRTGAAAGIGTIGAIAAPAVGATAAVGGMVGGALGGLAFNTGEAVDDQTNENLDVSRALALAQGGLYTAVDTIGVVPVVGKLFGKAVAQAGKKAVGRALTQGLREVGKAAVVKGAAKELAKTAAEEGVGEAVQSQVVGRGRRYLQTGSALKEGETPGEAFWEGVNEFVGGLVMGATLGGGPIAANTAGARRKVGIARSIAGKMGADEAFQSLSPEYQMLVGRHLMNESLLATDPYAPVLSDEERAFLLAQNRDIEKDLREDKDAGDAVRILDGMTTAYKLESKEVVVEAARANGEAPHVDFEEVRKTEHEIEPKDGHRVLAYYDKGTKQHLYCVEDGFGDGRDQWLLTPPHGVKEAIDSEPSFDDLQPALKAMEDNDIYNRYVAKNSGSKRSVIKQMVERMYNGEVNLRIADGPLGLDAKMKDQYKKAGRFGFDAAYDPETNTLHVLTDKVRSLGQLYTLLAHENMHKEISDYIKDTKRDTVDEGSLARGRLRILKSVRGSEGMQLARGLSENAAQEEVVAIRASVEDAMNALRSQNRTLVGEGVARLADGVKKLMGVHTGFTPDVFSDNDVANEIQHLLDRGDFGIKATVVGGDEVSHAADARRGIIEDADQSLQDEFESKKEIREKTDYQSVLDRDEETDDDVPAVENDFDKLVKAKPKSYAKFLVDMKLKDSDKNREKFFHHVAENGNAALVEGDDEVPFDLNGLSDEGRSEIESQIAQKTQESDDLEQEKPENVLSEGTNAQKTGSGTPAESDENGSTGVPGEKGTTSRPEAAKPVDKPNPSPAKQQEDIAAEPKNPSEMSDVEIADELDELSRYESLSENGKKRQESLKAEIDARNKPSKYGNAKQTAFFNDWNAKKPEGTTLVSAKLNEKGALIIRSTDADGKTTDTYVSKDGVSFVESAKVVNKQGKVLAGTAAQHAIDTKEERKARRVFAEENPGMAEFNYFVDRGEWLVVDPGSMMVRNRNGKGFHKEFMGGVDAEALNQILDGFKGKDRENVENILFGRDHRTSVKSTANDEVLENFIKSTGGDPKGDPRAHDYEGFIRRFLDQYAEYEEWKKNGMKTKEQIAAENAEAEAKAREVKVGGDSYDIENLADEVTSRELYDTALAEVEQNGEAVQMFGRGELKKLNGGDIIRFDHADSDWIVESYDDAAGEIVVTANDIADNPLFTDEEKKELTGRRFRITERGWVELKTKETKNGTESKTGKGTDETVAGNAQGERKAGGEDLKLESASQKELNDEQKRNAQRKAVAEKQSAPLKGGTGEVGQTLMDLGGAEGEDLFNRTQKSEKKPGVSKTETTTSTAEKRSEVPTVEEAKAAAKVLGMDAYIPDESLKRKIAGWTRGADKSPLWKAKVDAAKVILADRAAKGKADAKSTESVIKKTESVSKKTESVSKKRENVSSDTENVSPKGEKLQKSEKTSTAKIIPSENTTPTDEGFAAWAVDRDGNPLEFATDSDRNTSRSLFDYAVKQGLVDGKTGKSKVLFSRTVDLTKEETSRIIDFDRKHPSLFGARRIWLSREDFAKVQHQKPKDLVGRERFGNERDLFMGYVNNLNPKDGTVTTDVYACEYQGDEMFIPYNKTTIRSDDENDIIAAYEKIRDSFPDGLREEGREVADGVRTVGVPEGKGRASSQDGGLAGDEGKGDRWPASREDDAADNKPSGSGKLDVGGYRFSLAKDGSLDYEKEFNVRFSRTITTAGKYAGELRKLAHGMKRGDMKSMLIGADMMSPLIPQNAVIVPMPNHEGKPIRTMLLGYCISGVRDDVDVVPALLANPHEGSYHDKKIHKRPNVTMHRDESVTIPEGRPVVVIDNVIASGATWAAAQKVLPDADLVTLADARRKAAQDLYKGDPDFVFSKGEWEYAPKWTAPRLKRMTPEEDYENAVKSSDANERTTRSSVTPAEDAAYVEAVKRGDMETAQSMVNDAANRAGGYKWYDFFHGSQNEKIEGNKFDKERIGDTFGADDEGFFFHTREDIADNYRKHTSYGTRKEKPGVLVRAKLLMRNPLVIDQAWANRNGVPRLLTKSDPIAVWDNERDLFMDEFRNGGYDSIIIGLGNLQGHMAVVFEPSQIKSADPVTYDDAGNVIPLSQRFNQQSDDIRFSLTTSSADDPNVVFGTKEWMLKHLAYAADFGRKDNVETMRAGAERASDPIAVNALLDKLSRGEAFSDVEMASLIHVFADHVSGLVGLRNGMDAANGADRANEEELRDKVSDRIIEAMCLAGHRAGSALQILKMGIAMSGVKDTYAYLESEVKAIKAKKGLDPTLTDAERKMLEEQSAKLKELNDKLNAELAKRDTRIADLEATNRDLESFRKTVKRSLSREQKSYYGIKNEKFANAGIANLAQMFGRVSTARLARTAGASAEVGASQLVLTDDARDSFEAIITGTEGDVSNARKIVSETFGNEVAALYDEYVRERNAQTETRGEISSRMAQRAVDKDGERLARKKKRLDRRRNETIVALDEADEDLDARRKAIGRYIRPFIRYLVEADSSLSNEEIFQRAADEAASIDPNGKYDPSVILDIYRGRNGFDPATREATSKRMGELMRALELARQGKMEDAARVAGIQYTGTTDRLEKMERELKRMLQKKDDQLMDLLAEGRPDTEGLRAEVNRLKSEIAETAEMIRMMRKEISAAEKQQKMVEMLNKRLEEKRKELADLGGKKPDPAAKERLDEEIDDLKRTIKSVSREVNIQNRLNNEIADLERRIRENDFETAPVRPRIERSPEVNALMARRDALRRQLQHQRKMYQYKKRPLPFQMAIDFVHILSESKAIVGSLDLSSMFRQGGQLTFAHPLLFVKNFKKTIEAFKSDDAAVKMMGEILSRPNAKYYKDAGIDFTDWGDGAMSADDRFELYNNAGEGRKLLDFYHKVVKSRYIKMGVNASERAFAMYLNLMRADAFDQIVRNSPFGDASKMNRSQLKALGNFINIASQRGSIEKGSNLGKAINWMNYFLWSPRNLISRFQFLYNTVKLATPGANPYGDKTLRGLFAKELVRYIAGVATTITFAKLMSDLLKGDDEPPDEIEFDPRSSQFLRVKFGNTRVEFLSGLAQILTFSSRWFTGKNKNSRGQLRDTNFAEAFGKFVRTKLSPGASFFWDYSTGETFEHQDIVWDKPWASTKEEKAAYRHFAETFVPLTLTDLIEQGKYSGLDNTAVTAFLTILGAGVNAYDPLTYKQMTGDFHYYKRLYAESPEDERRRIELYHPMIRRAGAIEANIKRVNSLRTMLKKIEANGGDATAIRNAIERQQKVVINLISGAPNPSQVD